MSPADETTHQRALMAAHLKRLMAIDEQLALQPEHVGLNLDRNHSVTGANQAAARLGLGDLAHNLAAIVTAAGLHAEYTASLERQRQRLVAVQQVIELQTTRADAMAQVGLHLKGAEIAQQIAALTEQQALLAGAPAAAPPAAPPAALESAALQGNPRFARMLSVEEAAQMLDCAQAIAMITIDKTVAGQRASLPTGSAWLIAPSLAMTCWHVIEARTGRDEGAASADDLRQQLANCLLTFSYTRAGRGLEYGVEQLEHAHRSTRGLDYALLRLRDRADYPLAQRPHLRLDLDAPITTLSDLYIIQHPGGQSQQQSAGVFVERHPADASRIRYSNRTEGGASGGPVFNRANWRVVAIHQGAYNEQGLGILLRPILTELRQTQPQLYAEIMRAQEGAT